MSPATRGMVIVGAGLAGVSAAETMRQAGYGGPISLFDAEGELPYDRPPLSKGFASGEIDDAALRLRPPEWYESQGVALHCGVAISEIDIGARAVVAHDGERHPYRKLLLATGARARALPGLAPDHPNVLLLRTLADARRLKARLRPGVRVVLIGGGVIGMECAATAARTGCSVTVLEAGERIMARVFPEQVTTWLADLHRANGVDIRNLWFVDEIETIDGEIRVRSTDGATVQGDLIVVGIGSEPNTALASAAGLTLAAGGVAVDESGRTSDPDIYAVGDCAAFPDRGGEHVRWENWTHAARHAQETARAMLGESISYRAVPWIWSDQYDANIQALGRPTAEAVVVRGDPCRERFTIINLEGGRVVGAATVNNGRDKRPLEALVAAGAQIAPSLLADVSVALKSHAPVPASPGAS